MGQYQQALEYYQQALPISQEVEDQFAYFLQNQYGAALEYYQRALTIAREIGDRPSEGTYLINIGSVYATNETRCGRARGAGYVKTILVELVERWDWSTGRCIGYWEYNCVATEQVAGFGEHRSQAVGLAGDCFGVSLGKCVLVAVNNKTRNNQK